MKRYLILSAIILIGFIIISCSGSTSSSSVNDLFGIEMYEHEAGFFKIISYDDYSGANYQMSKNMNPDLFAYANIGVKDIAIKIVNNTDKEIPLNFSEDHFLLNTKSDKIFELSKGKFEDYPHNYSIAPNSFKEFMLELPTNFAASINKRDVFNPNPDYTFKFDKAENTLRIIKEDVRYLVINLGINHTLILKPLPENRKPTIL